jgi:hypothetical protein
MSTLWTTLQRVWSTFELGDTSLVSEADLFYAGWRRSAINPGSLSRHPGCFMLWTGALGNLAQLGAATLPVWGANATAELEQAEPTVGVYWEW